jgi:immune inhibitor A
MKKSKNTIITFLLLVFYAITASAVPASRMKHKAVQPDGSILTLRLCGDEHLHYTVTEDGYTVMKRADGYYCYAALSGSRLTATDIVAHDAEHRDVKEWQALNKMEKHIKPIAPFSLAKPMKAAPLMKTYGKAASQGASSDFKGLVLLIEWNDLSFSDDADVAHYTELMNKRGYTGFTDSKGVRNVYTGSVRDYFYENSAKQFDPVFDIVGPVKVDRSRKSPKGTENAVDIIAEALKAVDKDIDYSDFDLDGDGYVDMVYVIFAGYGSNFGGNNEDYIWPHAYTLEYSGLKLDGVKFGRYACSTELYGIENSFSMLDGIGTIAHEFSHVLGLMDHYDTDDAENGHCITPGDWDIMASGSYNNLGRTPAGYSGFERYTLGFTQPEIINAAGKKTLGDIQQTNKCFKMQSGEEKEYFIMECRRRTRWDAHLPGDGMLVWRVDSTNTSVWDYNAVNSYANHPFLELLRAQPEQDNEGYIIDSAGDPFPGTGKVTYISNSTEPGLMSWTEMDCDYFIDEISYSAGTVTFNVNAGSPDIAMEDFEPIDVFTGDASGLEGSFCKWDFVKSHVTAPEEQNTAKEKAVAIVRGGKITTENLNLPISSLTLIVQNPSSVTAQFKVHYSVDNGATWQQSAVVGGSATLSAGASAKMKFKGNSMSGTRYRISQSIGSMSSPCYIEGVNFRIASSDLADGIRQIERQEQMKSEDVRYNTAGQRVGENYKGIVIVNGRKVLSR